MGKPSANCCSNLGVETNAALALAVTLSQTFQLPPVILMLWLLSLQTYAACIAIVCTSTTTQHMFDAVVRTITEPTVDAFTIV